MKLPVMFYVVFATLVLLTVTLFASMGFPFHWVFYLMVFGQFLVVLMVYRVLKDDYTTNKSFKHFYEDRPVEEL